MPVTSPAGSGGAAAGRKRALFETHGEQEEQDIAEQLQQLRAHFANANELVPQQPDSDWTLTEWLKTIQSTSVLADALKEPAKKSATSDLLLLCTIATHGSKDLVLKLLTAGMVLERLAEVIWEKAAELSTDVAVTGSEVHGKFRQEMGNFDLSCGHLTNSVGELEALIGAPSPNILDAMEAEHCRTADSEIPWTSVCYGITSTPKIEWNFVMHPQSQHEWPNEQKLLEDRDLAKCRKTTSLETFEPTKDEVNKQLADMGEEQLTQEEVIGVRLYSGPMFDKYNGFSRGGALSIMRPESPQSGAESLHARSHYMTTVHVINSAIVKLSKLQTAQTVYRGIVGGFLPDEFWQKNRFGVCGGVELGFLSTTLDPNVAKSNAQGGQGKAAMLFEIQMGMIDRGADISKFSQYPHEQEICFPPLTGIEVYGTRVEGSMLIVQARANINLGPVTIEQVISKRRRVALDMCARLKSETLHAFSFCDDMDRILREENLLAGKPSLEVYVKEDFKAIETQDAEVFNDDTQLKQHIIEAFKIKSFAFIDCEALKRLGRRGKDAAACSALIAKRVAAPEQGISDVATETLQQLQVRTSDQQAIKAVIAKFKDDDWQVRQHSLATLGAIAERGNQQAITAVITCLEEGTDLRVRRAAAQAVGQIAQTGDAQVVNALACLLEDRDLDVCSAALSALRDLGEMVDPQKVKVLEALSRLKDQGWKTRKHALDTLKALAEKGNQQAIDAVIACLEDRHDRVRGNALNVLKSIAGRGDRQAIEAVIVRLEDRHDRVRGDALDALKVISEKGNQQAIEAVIERLKDQDWKVRNHALDTLNVIVRKGNQKAIQAVIARLKDTNLQVRQLALGTLAVISQKGDPRVIAVVIARLEDLNDRAAALNTLKMIAERGNQLAYEAVAPCLKDENWQVRQSAYDTVAAVAKTVDQLIITAAFTCLDGSWDVRRQALDFLGAFAKTCNQQAIAALITCLQDQDWKVRRHVLDTLKVTVKGHQQAIKAVIARLDDQEWKVRKHALDTLNVIARKGSQQVIEAVIARLQDQELWVRQRALETLEMLAPRGTERAVEAVIFRLDDTHREVRSRAVETLVKLADKGSRRAIELVLVRLKNEDTDIRMTALSAIDKIALKGDHQVIDAVVARLEDPEWTVRRCALQTLTFIAEDGNQQALQATIACLEDQYWRVRGHALEALRAITEKGHEKAVAAVIACLADQRAVVRQHALDTLDVIAEKGNQHAVAALITCAEDTSDHVRLRAVCVLGRFAEMGDKQIVKTLTARLQDRDEDIRSVALQILGRIAERGDRIVMEAVAALLKEVEGPKKESIGARAEQVLAGLRG